MSPLDVHAVAVTLTEGLIGLLVALVGVVPSWLAYRKSQQMGDVPGDAGIKGGWDELVESLMRANEVAEQKIGALEAKIDRRDDDIDRLEAEIRALKAEVEKLATLVVR